MRRSTSRWCDRKKVTSRRGVLLSVLLCPGVRAAAAAAAMPMKGRFPVRRTLQYLQSGDIVFKSSVKVMTVNYNTHGELGEGASGEQVLVDIEEKSSTDIVHHVKKILGKSE
ncbi:hypothetical protein FKM82_004401 [Ascaphus truei]